MTLPAKPSASAPAPGTTSPASATATGTAPRPASPVAVKPPPQPPTGLPLRPLAPLGKGAPPPHSDDREEGEELDEPTTTQRRSPHPPRDDRDSRPHPARGPSSMAPRRAGDRDPYWDDDRRRPPPPPLSSRGRRNSRSISPARSFTSRGSWAGRSRSRSPPGRRGGPPPYGGGRGGGGDYRRGGGGGGGGYPDSPPRRRPFSRSPPRQSELFSPLSPARGRLTAYVYSHTFCIQPTCVAVVRGVAVRRVATEEDPPHLQTTAVGDPPLPVADGTVLLADAPCLALHLPSIAEEEGGGTGRRRRRHSVVGLTDPDRGHPLPVVGCRRR